MSSTSMRFKTARGAWVYVGKPCSKGHTVRYETTDECVMCKTQGDETEPIYSSCTEEVLDLIKREPGLPTTELKRKLPFRYSAIGKVLKELEKDGKIIRRAGNRGALLHYIPIEDSADDGLDVLIKNLKKADEDFYEAFDALMTRLTEYGF